MKRNRSLMMALAASVLVFAVIWAAPRPPAVDPNTIPFAVDVNQCGGEIIGWQRGITDVNMTWTFKVSIPADDPNEPLVVTASPGQLTFLGRTVGTEIVDTYRLTHVRGIATTEYANVTATRSRYNLSDVRTYIFRFDAPVPPVIFVQAPFWLPHAKAYLAGRDDAQKIWQGSQKHIMGMTARQANDLLYTKWERGEVKIP